MSWSGSRTPLASPPRRERPGHPRAALGALGRAGRALPPDRVHALAGGETRARLRRLRGRSGAWSVDDLDGFWASIWDFFDVQADAAAPTRARRRGRCPAPSGSPARASTTPSTSSRGTDDAWPSIVHASELRDLGELTLGRAARRRSGGVGRRAARARRRPRRPRRRLPAEHPRGDRRLPGRASIGAVWSSCSPDFGARQRDRPLRPDRAEGAVRRRRLPLRRQGLRPPRRRSPSCRRRCRPLEPPWSSLDRRSTSAAARARRRGTSCSPGPGASSTFEPRPLRPPALGPLLLRHDRACRRRSSTARAGSCSSTSRQLDLHARRPARRPLLLVHHDRLDDVELPRRRPADRGRDRALRRQPRPSRPGRALGPGRARRGDDVRHQRRLHRGLHEGRRRARRRPRPLPPCAPSARPAPRCRPRASTGSTSTSAPTPGSFSTSGGTDVCTAFVGGVPAAAGLPRRAPGPRAGRRRSRPGTRTASASSTRSASWSSPRRCPRCRSASGATTDGEPLPRELLRACTRASGATATGSRSPTRGTAVIYGRSDSTINRAGIRMGTAEIYRAVLSHRRDRRRLVVDVPQAGRRAGCRCSSSCARTPSSTTTLTQGDRRGGSATAARRATSPTRSSQVAEVPRTLTGKVLEVPVKRILMGTAVGQGGQPRLARQPGGARLLRGDGGAAGELSGAARAPAFGEAQRRQHREAPAAGDAGRRPARRSGSARRGPAPRSRRRRRSRPRARRPWAARERGTTKAKAIAIEAAAVAWPLGNDARRHWW